MLPIFVYGTLKPGEINHTVCAHYVQAVAPAIAYGSLYHLPFGYPAMSLDASHWVVGCLLHFSDPQLLTILDQFEQHDPSVFQRLFPTTDLATHQYQRTRIQTYTPQQHPLTLAWSYTMTTAQIQQLNGTKTAHNHWRGADYALPPSH